MNPFASSSTAAPAPFLRRTFTQPAMILFLSLAVIGLSLVGWRTSLRVDRAREMARKEAAVRGLTLELQFAQAFAAADLLGTLARQNGGSFLNFQQVAAEVMASHPGLASLELQPGGVLRDIAPRAGYERAIGFNVLTDPAQSEDAFAAIQSRKAVVSAPVNLYRGELGLVVRVPIFQQARDGRQVFWGFVAVSQRLPEALSRARLDELWGRGYEYVFFTPAAGKRKATIIAARGWGSFQDAEQYLVQGRDVKFYLAIQPRDGWVNTKRWVAEALGALAVAGLAGLLALFVGKWRGLDQSLAEANRGITREIGERKQAQEEARMAREAAESSRSKLQQAEQIIAELKTRIETLTRSAQAAAEAGRARQEQAEAGIAELQSQLETAARTTMDTATAAQQQQAEAEKTIADLRSRLETVTREAKEAAKTARAELKQAEQSMAELQARLEAATKAAQEGTESHAAQASQAESALAALRSRLETVSREAQEAAESHGAQLKEAEKTIRELKSRLRAAEKAEDRVAELTARLAAAEAAPQETPAAPGEEIEPAPETVSIPAVEPEPEPIVEESFPEAPAPEETPAPETIPVAETVEEPTASAEPHASMSPAPESALVAAATETVEPVQPAVPEPTPEPAPEPKPEKSAKRKKARRDDQMSLFGEEPASPKSPRPAEKPKAEEPEPEPMLPLEEPRAVETASEEPRVVAEPVASPAPAPAVELDLPEIDGLNSSDGLARADSNPKAYLKALREFLEQQAGAAEMIRDLLVQGDPTAAGRMTTQLKDAAAEIGAEFLAGSAGELERAIHGPSDPAEVESRWAALEKTLSDLVGELKPALKPKEERAAPVRALPPPPPVNPSLLRKAVNQILPLLTDQDPGAKDCLKDNRNTFRSAFSPEAFLEFEQCVKSRDFMSALDQLKKAAKKHGISV